MDGTGLPMDERVAHLARLRKDPGKIRATFTLTGDSVIRLEGTQLSCVDVVRAARRGEPVELTTAGRGRAESSFRFANQLAQTRPVYGRSTGVGANRSIAVTDSAAHALSLLRSHATSAGPVRSPERVRAMLVVRLNQLAAGGSGCDPAVLDALAAMIAADALPTIRQHGGIGTGDLSALATTALALLGEGATARKLPGRVTFNAPDALPFISSNAATLADAALAYVDLEELSRAAVVVAALTFAAINGNPEAFSPAVERVTPFAGSRRVCGWMRTLINLDPQPARIQDPFGLRAFPQVQGAAVDALHALDNTVVALINAPAENPVFLPDVAAEASFAHHGGFHAAQLQMTLDSATVGVAQTGQLVLARLATLIEPAFTGLAPFLGDGAAGASGVMIVEYVAASALAELRASAVPAGLQTVVLSRGVEEDSSFASLAARQALGAVENYRILIACELVAAIRALRMQRREPYELRAALEITRQLSSETVDRDLSADIEQAATMLAGLAAGLAA